MTDVQIQVYGKPACQQCRMTTGYLDTLQVPYTYLDVSLDQSAADMVAILGYRSLPVVVAGDMHWSMFRHTKLKRLAEIHSTAPDLAPLQALAEQYLEDRHGSGQR